ncbi:MAG: TIGR01906 family membrane protein [Chloroflexi bacterium]|nr:TIGR01906 family membrane protein [Chloroflexota bacterium]
MTTRLLDYKTILRWLVIIAAPLLLTVVTMRVVITWDLPSYPEFEYGRIPPDRYGFTDKERLGLAEATLAYLRQPEPAEEVIFMLEELRLPGTDQPLYNDGEISHMLDVKIVADAFKRVGWILAIIVIGGLVFLLAQPATRALGYKTIMHSGLLTAGILIVVGILIGAAWNFVFVQFHEILFPPGSWTFAYTDSLIRLFPEKFWFDFGVIWVGGILIEGIILAAIGYFLQRSRS